MACFVWKGNYFIYTKKQNEFIGEILEVSEKQVKIRIVFFANKRPFEILPKSFFEDVSFYYSHEDSAINDFQKQCGILVM